MSVCLTDTIFPGTMFMCSPNRYLFYKSAFIATERYQFSRSTFFLGYRTDNDFPGALFLLRTDIDFPGSHFWISTNRYQFLRSTSYSYRTDKDFPGSLFEYQRTDRQFPGRNPPPNRYFSNRSRWLLSEKESTRLSRIGTWISE